MSPRDLTPPTPRTPQQNDQDAIVTPDDLTQAIARANQLANPQYKKILNATKLEEPAPKKPSDPSTP